MVKSLVLLYKLFLLSNTILINELVTYVANNTTFVTNLVENNYFTENLAHDTTFINNLVADNVFLSQLYDDTHLKQLIDSLAALINSGGDSKLIETIVKEISKETNIIQLGDSLAYYYSQTVLGDTIANNLLNNNQYITNLIDTLGDNGQKCC